MGMKTVWECHACRRRDPAGKAEEFGAFRLYLCGRHAGGRSIVQEMANVRRRKANDESIRKRGFGSRVYLNAIANEGGNGD